ncbi:hypothetical protein IC235_20350 [Hymenobacter sp. BT664]|uniref:Uncharacterized protein n=1 Tax=Hymenobacter montanus TaxID=2771359 RepID=A0A927GLJ3_9BACT|nr:hypothetical protein [Hymenobacter montanus]MBD2770244.1 hypothetical protein [Hymenobacter montanus]
MARFLLHLALLTLGLAALIYLLKLQFGPPVVHPYASCVLLLLAVLTGGTYYLTARVTAVKKDYFIAAYFGGVVVRFLGSLLVLGLYLYRAGGVRDTGTMSLLITFFLLYFLYAGFEIWAILSNLRPFSKSG